MRKTNKSSRFLILSCIPFQKVSSINIFHLSFSIHCCCVEGFRIRSSSGPYFPSFRRNTEIYKVNIIFSWKARKYGPEKLLIRTLFEQCHTSAKFEMQSNKWEHYLYIFNEATHYFSTPNITLLRFISVISSIL